MKISSLKINGMKNPLGISNNDIFYSFVADCDGEFTATLTGGNKTLNRSLSISEASYFTFDTEYESGTAYRISVKCGEAETEATFETAYPLTAPFITPVHFAFAPVFERKFNIDSIPQTARLIITGLGIFRAFINSKPVGDDYLAPGFNDYDAYLRYYTYDCTSLLTAGENNLTVHLGDGWYKGRFGIDNINGGREQYGKDYILSVLLIADGHTATATDLNWTCREGQLLENSIYDGEVRDYTKCCEIDTVKYFKTSYNLVPPFSEPIREKKELSPILISDKNGDKILDFGQNMVGFVRFNGQLEKGQKLELLHSELLEKGVFTQRNLRTAKARSVYIGDGKRRTFEPMFTFFGFRYVKVSGLHTVNPDDFKGIVIYSDLEKTISCSTNNKKINRLLKNAFWGQRGNFLDIPTDCPQRDERLGWTADTQVFTPTACYNMDCFAFYKKYMRDLRADQTMYYGGDLPAFSPSLKMGAAPGGAVWADAATIIPWNLYVFYGNTDQLAENFQMMKDYSDCLINKDFEQGNRGLITEGFTFGDWLAQDGVCAQSMTGGTDNGYIMSIYYYNSLRLTAKAAEVLGFSEEQAYYSLMADNAKNAILSEYFSPNGKLAVTTQTGYILSLYFGIYRDRQKIITDLKERLRKDFYKMKSGFCGTPLMLLTLFDNRLDDDAYRILFNEECPGWLYAVNLGATTIWERWNSLLPDGTLSGTAMNSLNHYAYGSVAEAIYSRIAGLRPSEAGFKAAVIEPHPNYRLKKIKLCYKSAVGEYKVNWELTDTGVFELYCLIPPSASARVILPDGSVTEIKGGEHTFAVTPTNDYLHPFSLNSPILDILENEQTNKILKETTPKAYQILNGENAEFKTQPLGFIGHLEMFGTTPEIMKTLDEKMKSIKA